MAASTTGTAPLPNLTRTFIGYELVAIVISTLSALAVITALAHRTRSCNTATFTKNLPMVMTLLFAWLYASVPLSMALMYFGVPKLLTFGYQVGGILPTSCEASMDVEGAEGLPCGGKRFLSWAGEAIRDGDLHMDQFEEQWRDKALLWTFHMAIIVLSYFFWKFIGRLADKEIAEIEEQERMKSEEAEEEAWNGKED